MQLKYAKLTKLSIVILINVQKQIPLQTECRVDSVHHIEQICTSTMLELYSITLHSRL